MGNDDIVARLHAKKYTREAWDEPYGAYDQPCDADDYGAEERLVNPDGPEAVAEIERLRGLFRLDGEQHAQHIKRLTEAHEARITKYATALAERDATIERLNKLVYVPGLWTCPKCKFSLLQANINASDGTVTARDQRGDKCPNCSSPLWRVTERDAGNEMVDRAEEYLARAATAERDLAEARADLETAAKDAEYLLPAKVAAERERDEARAEVERLKAERDTMEEFIRAVASKKHDHELLMSNPPKPVISYTAARIVEGLDRTRAALTAKGGENGN